MKRLWIAVLACAVVSFNLLIAKPAQAFPFPAIQLADVAVEDALTQLKNEVLPELENILTPEQREQFKSAIAAGTSVRKAFKGMTLTPDQKTKLKGIFKTIPGKASFASLTPEQKKQLFMQKKDAFKPTPEEIAEKIDQGMKMKGASMPKSVSDKIAEKMKGKESFTPTPEAISKKISDGMKMAQEKMSDMVDD